MGVRRSSRLERDGEVIAPAPSFHDLRHTHGSALIAAGLDIEQVSARLGHASVAVTQAEYIHEYDKARRSPAGQAREDVRLTAHGRGSVAKACKKLASRPFRASGGGQDAYSEAHEMGVLAGIVGSNGEGGIRTRDGV